MPTFEAMVSWVEYSSGVFRVTVSNPKEAEAKLIEMASIHHPMARDIQVEEIYREGDE